MTRTTAILWLGLVLFVALAIALLLPIQPNDYWWYVRLGGEIAAARAVPHIDTYTYTRAGQPMVYHSWLAALLFWGLRQWGGDALTVLGRGILLAIFYALIWRAGRLAGAGPRLSALLTLLSALAGSNNWAMRPQLFSYPLFAAALVCLWQWRQGRNRQLWLLPLLAALWVNLHGAFALAFLLVGAALVGGGGNRRALAAALAGMFLAALLNPRGWGAWSYVAALLSDPASRQLGAEWRPPTIAVWQGALFFGWLILLPVMAILSPRKLSLTGWLWFLGFGAMALTGLRYVIWFLAIAVPLSAQLLAPVVGHWLDRSEVRGVPALNGLLALLLLALPLTLLPGLREKWWPDAPPVLSPNTPVAAINWLAARPELPGPLWSDLAFSSYLIYALPERPVWIDPRFELFPLEQWQDYINLADAAPGWPDILAGEGINLLLLDPGAQAPLLNGLADSAEWCAVYRDQTAVIFSRRTTQQPCQSG